MFGFLKDKIKSALGKLTKEVEKEAVVETKEVVVEKKVEKEIKKEKPKVETKPVVEKKETVKEVKTKEPVKEISKKPSDKTKTIISENKKTVESKSAVNIPKIESKKEEKKSEEKIETILKEELEQKPVVKEVQNIEVPKAPSPDRPAEKKGFFQRIFGSKDKESVETKKDSEEIIEFKEELRATAEKTDIEPVDLKEVAKEEEVKESIKEETKKDIPKSKIVEKKIIIVDKTQLKSKKQEVSKKEDNNIISETVKEVKKEIPKEEIKHIEVPKHQEVKKIIPQAVQEKQKSHNVELEEERASKVIEHKEESKGFFSKITETFTKIQISDEKFEELFWDLEVAMLENNVAVEVIDKIKRDLKKELMAGKVSRTGVEEIIAATLKKSIVELFDVEKINLIERIKSKKSSEKKPYIISIIGVNGSGKTTSIAKLTHKLQKNGLSVVLAASDTFRAAAIQQLEEHANRLNVKIVKHEYNSDPAAVAFDAIKYAEAKNIDVVLIDTAGRLHSNTNLMRELEKIIRVCKPDIKIFVGESITGNDCVEQAKEFDNAVGIDAIILAKADIDDKGGAAISVSYILQRPILYLGTGQTYDDLKDFDSQIIIDGLGL